MKFFLLLGLLIYSTMCLSQDDTSYDYPDSVEVSPEEKAMEMERIKMEQEDAAREAELIQEMQPEPEFKPVESDDLSN